MSACRRFPSRDIIVGAYLGTYSSEDFGASFVYGVRLGYHITEDFFVEAVYGTTSVSDENYRQILPGGVFPEKEETLIVLQPVRRLQHPAGRGLLRQPVRDGLRRCT